MQNDVSIQWVAKVDGLYNFIESGIEKGWQGGGNQKDGPKSFVNEPLESMP